MNKVDCPKFDNCSAPLCPLQENTVEGGIYYPGEEICKRRDFQSLPWIRKQKAIVKAKAPNDRYFTVAMLRAVTRVQKGIEGINSDQPLRQAEEAEETWVSRHQKGRYSIAKRNLPPLNSIAKERHNLVSAGKTTH